MRTADDLTKEDLISCLLSGMTCQIIGLKFGVSHNKINHLLRKYEINLKEVQSSLPKYYVYAHTYQDEVFYVGSAQGNPRRAWDMNARSQEWLSYTRKINYQFNVEFLEYCDSQSKAASRESYWGQVFKDKGEAHLYFEDLRGEKNPSKKKENKLKIMKGREKSKRERDENYAKNFTPSSKLTGIQNIGRNRKVIGQYLEGKLVAIYESIEKASLSVGVNRSTISRACSERRTHKGFEWKVLKCATNVAEITTQGATPRVEQK